MLDKLVFKLVLVMIWNTAAAAPRRCSQSIPASCVSNTNIRIVRRNDHYDLQLCSNSQCIPAAEENKWIRCNKMCDACKEMANSSYCGTNEGQCERVVSTFLDNYCSSNTPSTSTQTVTTTARIIATPSVTTTTRWRIRWRSTTDTQIVTTNLPCQTVTRQLTSTTTVHVTMSSTGSGSTKGAPTAVLGVLFGLSMILLVIVTTGWVWTLWKMKKKKSEKARSGANTTNGRNTAELCFQNPTYNEMSTKKQVTLNETEATYDMVTSPHQTTSGMSANGQNYAKLNTAVRNGHKPANGTHTQQADVSYGELDFQDKDTDNVYSLAREEEEDDLQMDGENVYHALEGPGDDDYADPDMEAEMMGGATEYEVPVLRRQAK